MTKPTRVLHVLGELNRGGAETMIMNLYRNMDRTKFQFDFVVHTNKECSYDNEVISLGGKIFRVPKYKVYNHFEYVRKWETIFAENNEYNLIHSHVRSTAKIFLKIAKKRKMKTILHSHNTSSGKGIKALFKTLLQKNVSESADYLFACSTEAGEWLFGKQIENNSNYHHIKNAIDTDNFKFNKEDYYNIRNEFNVESEILITHVGRFHPQKNHKFIIDIFDELLKLRLDVKLILVGDGEMKDEIIEEAKTRSIFQKIIFTGVRSDINKILNSSDMFLFPSLHEGLPLTLIEAQSSGLPIFASDKISKEICVTDLVTFLPLDENPKIWANKISEFKKAEVDRSLYSEEVSNAGYGIEMAVQNLTNIYTNILSRNI